MRHTAGTKVPAVFFARVALNIAAGCSPGPG